jgi:hypothetical protein
MDSAFEQGEIQSSFNTQDYLKGLAEDKAKILQASLDEQIEKATGISNLVGTIQGSLTGIKGLKESVEKAQSFYKAINENSNNPSDTKNLIKNEIPNETEPQQGIIRKVDLPPETDDISENVRVPDLEPFELRRRQNLLDRGEELPDYMKTQQISPEAREIQIQQKAEKTPFQSDEINDKPAFTRATEDIAKDTTEKIGGDILEEGGEKGLLEGLGEAGAQLIPGLDIVADIGLLGSVIFGSVKEAIQKKKVEEKENAFQNQLRQSNIPIPSVQNIVAPTQQRIQQGGLSTLD